MQPRRNVFGLSYIGQTVSSYVSLATSDNRDAIVGAAEFQWMTAVLRDYFAVTAESGLDSLLTLGERFREVSREVKIAPHISGPHQVKVEPERLTISALANLARSRRSVRWFQSKPVDREIVDAAIAIGREAPTACNRQPYRFEIFDDPELVARVCALPMGAAGYSHQVPGVIVVIGDLSAFFDERDRHLIYIDSSLASMGLILGLEAQGIASCVINWPDIAKRERSIVKLLKLKKYERVIMMIAYGYPLEGGMVPFSEKRDLEQVRRFRTQL